jgi:hypothetical protein
MFYLLNDMAKSRNYIGGISLNIIRRAFVELYEERNQESSVATSSLQPDGQP